MAWGEPGEEAPEEAVVVISDPVVSDDGLSYQIKALRGRPAGRRRAVRAFLDPLGRPLSPVSVCGVRRREMRRERRRL